MKCGRCGKNFDEDMYSGICPKCGYFNNRQKEYDVSEYISARFDGGEDKVSTSAQAAKQHKKLHRMYDSQDMHRQAQKTLSGYQQPVSMGKNNPYQNAIPVQPVNTYHTGQLGNYGQSRQRHANAYGEEKKKNIITPICVVTALLAIGVTVIGCQLKRQSLEEAYHTLDFERETAQPGELFAVGAQFFMVEEAKTVDTSEKEGMPEDEKLIAVSVELLPTEEQSSASGIVYVSDGSSYKMSLEDYTVRDILYDGDYSRGEDILSQYDFEGNTSNDGKTGKLYFLVDENAEEICISFEEGSQKNGMYVLRRRVSVPLLLEEDGI